MITRFILLFDSLIDGANVTVKSRRLFWTLWPRIQSAPLLAASVPSKNHISGDTLLPGAPEPLKILSQQCGVRGLPAEQAIQARPWEQLASVGAGGMVAFCFG